MRKLARVSITHAHQGEDLAGNNDFHGVFPCLNDTEGSRQAMSWELIVPMLCPLVVLGLSLLHIYAILLLAFP
jgi:hypothetical protein